MSLDKWHVRKCLSIQEERDTKERSVLIAGEAYIGAMFTVGADAYDRFMGRYSTPLAPGFCEFSQVAAGQRVLDVGCGPGALTAELVKRLGTAGVSAVEPSEPFVEAARERHPGVDVRQAAAEQLPFSDGDFDASLAQLVVNFMASPIEGLSEMARVTRPGGVVAACVWDHDAGGEGALSRFWEAARELDPEVEDESELAGSRRGHLAELLREAGLQEVEETVLSVSVEHATFDEWWGPFTFGVGTVGAYLSQLDQAHQARLREHCRDAFPEGGLVLAARAWAARGRAY
jgi:ubiquinone/menaquinone biosynthesis C-methylase UbiE